MLTGFIFTNTNLLAKKLKVSRGEVCALLKNYMEDCSFIQWQMIDVTVVDGDLTYSLEDWHYYLPLLRDNRLGFGLDQIGAYNTPLFIIGDESIIPMPRVISQLIVDGEKSNLEIPADILYCFDEGCENNYEQLIQNKPYFAVGRLPIVEGMTIQFLSNYLAKSSELVPEGIQSRGAIMTTAESWVANSAQIVSDIPKVTLSSAFVPTNNDMVVCPLLNTTVDQMYQGYIHELQKADVWVFNLHGTNEQGASSFVGESKQSTGFPIAMQTSILNLKAPVIFNTLACYGGRYTNYSISDSMMLSALTNGTMLYCGAGHVGFFFLERIGMTNAFMKLYNIYLHQGYPAGMALIKAKQDYYVAYHAKDDDDFAIYTVLEFNLFGNPILAMRPQLDFDYQTDITKNLNNLKSQAKYRPKSATPLFDQKFKFGDLSLYVKHSADQQLAYAYQQVVSECQYYFHTSSMELKQVYRMSDNGYQIGFRFVFYRSEATVTSGYNMMYIAECDMQGNNIRLMGTN